MKKLSLLFLAIFAFMFLVACEDNDDGAAADNGDDTTEAADDANDNGDDANDNGDDNGDDAITDDGDADMQIALVAHSPDSILDDGSFNQGAWDGIQRFIADNGIPADNANFSQPHEASDEARLDLMFDAVEGGADVLVLPGFHFESSLYDGQLLFPEATFILLDATPAQGEGDDRSVRVEDNVAAIHYAEEEAGFLAGYAAVMEGYRELGFMGGIAVPAVVRFGHGFIQGADHAADSLGLGEGEVTINYMYLGGFAPDPAHTTTAAAWYAAGTEVIFAAAGGAGGSVMSAAEGADAAVIGVDVDQAHLSPSVITSAVKGLDVSVYDMLTDFMNNTFNGGIFRFDASNNGVGLAMDSSQFDNFTMEQYENIFNALATGEINVNDSLEMDDIEVSLVEVNNLD